MPLDDSNQNQSDMRQLLVGLLLLSLIGVAQVVIHEPPLGQEFPRYDSAQILGYQVFDTVPSVLTFADTIDLLRVGSVFTEVQCCPRCFVIYSNEEYVDSVSYTYKGVVKQVILTGFYHDPQVVGYYCPTEFGWPKWWMVLDHRDKRACRLQLIKGGVMQSAAK